MSDFLKFLGDMKAYIPSVGDILKMALSSRTGLVSTNQGTADFVTDEERNNLFNVVYTHLLRKSESFYAEDQRALFYPEDLFQHGNEAYILFYMRDSIYATAKLMKRIALYMPPSIAVNYGANWQPVDMLITKNNQAAVKASAENLLNQFANANSSAAIKTLMDSFKTDGTGSVSNALTTAAMKFGAQSIMTNTGIGQAASYLTQKSINPMTALSFTKINLRKFKFKFELMARSAAESDSINDIITSFKYGMHPGTTKSNEPVLPKLPGSGLINNAVDEVFLNYPNTFDIFLYSPSSQYLFNIQRSVLESMDVQYNGNNVASFFKETGAPTNITLELQFSETELLTKERVVKGF